MINASHVIEAGLSRKHFWKVRGKTTCVLRGSQSCPRIHHASFMLANGVQTCTSCAVPLSASFKPIRHKNLTARFQSRFDQCSYRYRQNCPQKSITSTCMICALTILCVVCLRTIPIPACPITQGGTQYASDPPRYPLSHTSFRTTGCAPPPRAQSEYMYAVSYLHTQARL